MRKPGRSQERDIIGAERKCAPNAQWDYLTKPFANQLGESMIEIRRRD
jgi:hypothetical protein